MSLYEALVNRFVMPVIEAHKAEGYAEGYPEGYAEGLELARSEWREWRQRRMEASARGLPFDEPPPGGWPEPHQSNPGQPRPASTATKEYHNAPSSP